MKFAPQNTTYYPLNYPMNFSGKLTAKIVIKDDYIRTDGTSALFLQVFLNGKRKRFPLHINVAPKDFDKIKQRVKPKAKWSTDFNLLIEKYLGDLNLIEINYRLSSEVLTLEKLTHEFLNPSSRIDFIKFWEVELENQKKIRDIKTYEQQTSSWRKVKKYQSEIRFYEIDAAFFEKMLYHFKNVEKNKPHTLQTVAKNFKKYLHIAHDRGIITPLSYKDIKTPKCISNRTFLNSDEIMTLHKYYQSDFIPESIKNILARFLFSCFTGLRISDIKRIGPINIVGDVLVFNAKKTDKLQRIQMNESALSFLGKKQLFEGDYTEQHINRELKLIAKSCGIRKNISFHVARHTFATNFLICGGNVEVLQELLGHSQIGQTMDYVHIVRSVSNNQLYEMDSILKKPQE